MSPAISIIVPAYNEENYLAATLGSIQQSTAGRYEDVQIVVVDNNSTDNTAKIAEESGAEVVFEPVNQISRARNAGARVARYDFLLFIDADTLVDQKLLDTALNNLSSTACVGGGAIVKSDKPLPPLMQFVLAVWNWIGVNFKLAAGCFIYCRRDAFEAVGGFSERVYASEELWLSRALKKWGRRQNMKFIMITDHGPVSSMRKVEWHSQWKIFMMALALLFFPFILFFKELCSLWYKRPDQVIKQEEGTR